MRNFPFIYMQHSWKHYFPRKFSSWALLLICYFYTQEHFIHAPWKEEFKKVIDYDVLQYYSYLPAAFIEKDLRLDFYRKNPQHYHLSRMYWPQELDDGSYVIKVSYGVSLAYLPFFGVAHAYCLLSDDFEASGFTLPYAVAISLAGWFWLCLGFVFLMLFLRAHFDDPIVAVVILALAFATNLYYTLLLEASMSHPFNFGLGSLFLFSLHKFRTKSNFVYLAIMAFVGGWMFIIRPTNALYLALPLFYWPAKSHFKENLYWWKSKKWLFAFAAVIFILPILPQLLYWKIATDEWLIYSYNEERFYLTNPHILEGLFSYRKGWLVYTPIMVLSLLGLGMTTTDKGYFRFWPLFIVLYIYVIFSWWCWWFGGGFGSRVMIDIYPLLAVPIAFTIRWIWKKGWILRLCTLILIYKFYGWNIRQTHQFSHWGIHYDSMTKDAFWYSVEHKFYYKPEEFQALLSSPDYDAAVKGEDEYEFDPFK